MRENQVFSENRESIVNEKVETSQERTVRIDRKIESCWIICFPKFTWNFRIHWKVSRKLNQSAINNCRVCYRIEAASSPVKLFAGGNPFRIYFFNYKCITFANFVRGSWPNSTNFSLHLLLWWFTVGKNVEFIKCRITQRLRRWQIWTQRISTELTVSQGSFHATTVLRRSNI